MMTGILKWRPGAGAGNSKKQILYIGDAHDTTN